MENKILVLGATGNIGSFLLQDLKKMGIEPLAGVPATELPKIRNVGVDGAEVDFNDTAALDAAMDGINAVFMLLPMSRKMTGWAANIVSSALKQNVRFILRSSLMDARADSPYSLFRAHGRVDKIVIDSGIPYCVVRPNSFMQNFVVYYSRQIESDDAFYFTWNESVRVSFVDVRDIAASCAAILANPAAHAEKEYTLTGPEALSGNDIAEMLSSAADRRIRYERVETERYAQGLRLAGMSEWEVESLLSLEAHINDGKQAEVTKDVQRLTGLNPIPFARFAGDYSLAWKKAPARV